MFDLAERPLVWIPIKWSVLRPGKKETDVAVEVECVIEVEVEIKDRDEIAEISVDMFGLDTTDEETPSVVDQIKAATERRDKEAKLFCDLVARWRKVKDSGVDLELNLDNARKMLGVPGFWGAFQAAYMSACVGKRETRKGN